MNRRTLYGILGVVCVGVLLIVARPPRRPMSRAGALTTVRGQLRSAGLADQSHITLNTDSSVAVDMEAHSRIAHLTQGEAIFRVNSKDPRPFQLYCDDIVVSAPDDTVASTQDVVFSARKLHHNALLVQVLSGSVFARERVLRTLEQPFQLEMHLGAGKGYDIDTGTLNIRPFPPASADCAWAWERGELCLDDEPLPEALQEINRYTSRPVVMSDPSLATYRVGGTFRIATLLPDFAEALQSTFGIRAVTRDDKIFLLPPTEAAAKSTPMT